MDRPLPVTITLLDSIKNSVTSEQLLDKCSSGHYTRSFITCDETVASFCKKYALYYPDWMYLLCKKHGGAKTKGDRDVLIKFGDDQSVTIQIRSDPNVINSSNKKVPFLSFALGLYLVENEKPALLRPGDDLYRIIQASHTSTEIPELRLCPSQIWGDSDEIVVSDTSITFLVKKNKELQKVVVNAERPPVVPRVEKGSESQGSMESNKKRKDSNAEIPDTTKEPRVSPRKKKSSNTEIPDTTKEPRVSPRKKKNSNAKIPDATEEPMVSQKKKKNSNTPKLKSKSPARSKSAYNLFFKEAYNTAKAKEPSLTMAEINSKVAKEWKSLSANKRKKYEEKANEEKLLLAEEKEKNTPPPSEDDDKEIEIATTKKKRKRKDPQMPKFYDTAYKLYTASIRAETKAKNPDISFGEMSKILADKWNSLSSTEKLKFEELSQKDKARYTEEMSKYEPPEDASEEEVTAKKKKKTKDPNAPKGRLNVFMSFSNDMRSKIKKENPEASFLQIASILGEKYKQLTPSQKAKYQKIADQDKSRYEKEMEKYKSKGKDIEVNVNADTKQGKGTDDELPAEKPAESKKEIRRDSTGVRKEMNAKITGSKKSTTTVTPKKKKTTPEPAVESVVGRTASPVTTRSKRSKKQASRKKRRRSKTT